MGQPSTDFELYQCGECQTEGTEANEFQPDYQEDIVFERIDEEEEAAGVSAVTSRMGGLSVSGRFPEALGGSDDQYPSRNR